MKKFLSFVLSILMIMSCSSMVMADVTFEGGKTVAYEIGVAEIGDKIAVPVNLVLADSFADDVGTGKVIIKYDNTKLAYDSFEKKVEGSINVNGKVAGTVQANVTPDEAFTESTTFLVLYFTAIEGATGDVELTFDTTRMNAATAAGTRLDFQVVNGKVSLGGAVETPKYEVTFDGEDAQEYEEGTEITLPTPADKEGYSFLGWSDGTEVYTGKYTVTGAVDFVSEWEINKYTVTVEDEKNDTTEESVEYNSQFTLPTPEAVEGFIFAGWECDGETYEAGAKVTVKGDMTFTAVWNRIEKYTVTFVTDYGTAPENMTDVVAGTKITLVELDDTADFTFGGWTDGENEFDAGEEYEVTGDVTLAAIWNRIVKYTVTFSEGDFEPITVVAGESVTVPTLTKEDLIFKGWKVGDTDEIIAGGAEFTPTVSVLLTAQWKAGSNKIYIDTTGNDANDGLTKETPVKTLKRAQEILEADKAADNILNTIVVVEKYEKKNESAAGNPTTLGKGLGKKIYITGLTAESVFDMCYYNASGSKVDSHLRIYGDLEFNNIKIIGSAKDGGIMSMGYELTFGENIVVEGAQNVGVVHYNAQYASNSVINMLSGSYNKVDMAVQSGATYKGKSTINIGGTAKTMITNGHGWQGNQSVFGIVNVNVNGGEVTFIRLTSTADTAITNYSGLRYFTINDGTVGDIYTTGSSVSKKFTKTDANKEVIKDDEGKPINFEEIATARAGVTVIEYNGGTVGSIKIGTNLQTNEADPDDSTRVVILNNGKDINVEDAGAIVVKTIGGTVKAATNAYDIYPEDNTTLDAEWGKSVVLEGFTYELDGDYNAVKVGDKTYMLAELEGGLIPAPEAAGAYDVEFINVYTVIVNGEEILAKDGEVINLERLPQNGDLKHIGWATTEGATTATINHTAEYTVTGNATLYPVWAEAVYFTISFVSAHGEQIEAISLIDDDEDGKADAATRLPGYDATVKYDDHFTFLGWSEDEAATEVTIAAGAAIENLAKNIVLYAVWEEDAKGTVTYRNESGEAPESYTEYVGTEIVIAECPAVEGFEFLGWISNGVTYQPGDKVIIEDEFGITFTAKWGVKVTVDVNGAKGDAPVIGGTIGEEIDLPTSVELTKINSTFVGFALSADGEVITGKYTVNPEDTLYVIWEETVADAGLIKTKVTYYTGAGNYLVDVYFYGKDANTVAFGYAFGENLEFAGFTPAEGLSAVPADLETIAEGYYAYAVTDEMDGKIEGADKTEDTAILLGTIAFTYTGAKEDYETDCADCNIAITAPAETIENISSEEYFLYTPAVAGLEVEGKPVVFDEAIEIEIIDVVYTLTGSVKVVRADGTAPKNYATITAYNAAGIVVKTFTIEDEATETTDGVFNYSIELPEGSYTLEIDKIGYMPASVDVEIVAQEGADEEGFVPTPVEVEAVELIAGDVVEVRGEIDLLDFAAITSTFDVEIADEFVVALDINEDGVVSVDDLAYVKQNYGASNAQ